MREFSLDYVFLPAARQRLERLSDTHRSDMRTRVDLICRDPWPDDRLKFAWPDKDGDRILFDDDAWEMIYRVVDDGRVIEIMALSPVGWLRGSD